MSDDDVNLEDFSMYVELAMRHVRGEITLAEMKAEIKANAQNVNGVMEICKDEFDYGQEG